ncbi:MAG TPA: 7TM domain-containing protein [Patescibacteria group bacterium]|nr:7TM domain-containing protein [Patescibacteria group bacterium]
MINRSARSGFFGGFLLLIIVTLFTTGVTRSALAQTPTTSSIDELSSLATDSALFASEAAKLASPSAEELEKLQTAKKEDITRPEEIEEKGEFFELFSRRPVTEPSYTNFLAYTVQYAVAKGVPANTLLLLLLLPFLATAIAFFRHIVGLPTLGILFPVALSITLLATGIVTGLVLLAMILLGTFIARVLLRKLRIMHMPKLALSVMLLSLFVFAALVVGALYGVLTVKKLSIFPVLLLILLSERIIELHLERKMTETTIITATNITLGIAGFFILSAKPVQNMILLYPELIFVLIPLNIAIGRYFGLRISEYFRFKDILER